MPTPTINSVLKAVKIVSLLAERRALTVTDCSHALGYPPSSVYRLLITLREAGLVEADDDGRFYLGLRLFELGSAVPRRRQMADRARRPMEEMSDQTGLQSNLATLSDGALVYLDSVHGRSSSTPVRVGQRGVLHAAGVGKILLAFAPEELIEKVAGGELPSYTRNTITEGEVLRRELADIRRHDFALDRQEVVRGLSCIAVPIRDGQGAVVAAVSLSGSTDHVEKSVRRLRDILTWTVRVIEGGMGWQPSLDDFLSSRSAQENPGP